MFKPDFSASQALLDLTLGKNGTYSDLQRIANLNIASAEVAEMLGTPSTVVKSRVGIHNGMFGIFMEVASGTAPGDIFDKGGNRDGIRLGDYTVGELKTLKITKPQDYLRFVGNLMHALNDLEWNDLITGQGDRHWCNYMVHVNRDLTVKVHGIDNDAAFPEWRLGAEKFQLSGERLVTFRELAESKGGPWTFDPAKLPEGSATPLRGVTVGPNGSLIVDVSRNRKLAPYMQSVFGIQKIITPRAISRQTYDRLCEMRELAHNDRDQFVSRFADKLTEGQIEAMIVRLEDAWQRAENLRAQGLVLDGEKRDAQNPAGNHPDQWCQASIRVRIVDGMVRDGYDNGQLNVITSELIVGDWLGVSGEINLPRSLRNVDGSYANV